MHPIILEELKERFYKKIDSSIKEVCWNWRGTLDGRGYPVIHSSRLFGKQKMLAAHRISYQIHKGNLDPNLDIDHMCENKKCVNPNHLRMVSSKVNTLAASTAPAAINARKTHCPQGHLLSGDNLRIAPGNKRQCRICRREQGKINARLFRQRNKK